MTFVPLGDQAVLAYLADEAAATRFAAAVRAANPRWLHDVVPAYASVGVFFDANTLATSDVIAILQTLPFEADTASNGIAIVHRIPVCYELGLDLPRVASLTKLSPERVIAEHVSTTYRVFAVGFVPGFPYLGYLPTAISGVPRLETPRLRVEPGSVGIAGKQTGLYPLPRPGGWNLLGRTPLTVVDVQDGFFPIRVGDCVQFFRIHESEFTRLLGERLPIATRTSETP